MTRLTADQVAASISIDQAMGYRDERGRILTTPRRRIYGVPGTQDESQWRPNGCREGRTSGYTWIASVYEVGSRFGIDGGRVSKLWIRDRDGREVYGYDRGLDHDDLPDGVLAAVLAAATA